MEREEDLIADSYWNQTIREWKTEKRRCARCKVDYFEVDNIGRWKCWQHPCPTLPMETTRWPCCNRLMKRGLTAEPQGCVRADHTVLLVPYDEENNIPIPKVIFEKVWKQRMFQSDSVVDPDSADNQEIYRTEEERAEADNYVTLRRYDLAATKTKNLNDIGDFYGY